MRHVLLGIVAFSLAVFSSRVEADDAATDGLEALAALLAQVDNTTLHRSLLEGMHDALEGRRNVRMPPSWTAAYKKLSISDDDQVREKALALALVFGDEQAVVQMRSTMLDRSKPSEQRRQAIHLLAQNSTAGLAPQLQRLLDDRDVRAAALRGLSAYDDSKTATIILRRYAKLPDEEKQIALSTLAARRDYATALLDAVADDQIDAGDISAFTARQIESLGDKRITARLREHWGVVRQTSAQRKALIAKYKESLVPELLEKADLSNGRLLYKRSCAQCHTLYGEGGKIGPDITGSNRANLDYILENVVDPSATVARAYRVTSLVTEDGRIVSGIVTDQTPRTVAVETINGRVVLDRSIIEQTKQSPQSMMPDGMLEKLTLEQVRDLVGYLRTKSQVPLPDVEPGE